MLQSIKQFLKRNRTIDHYNSVIKGRVQGLRAARSLDGYGQQASGRGLRMLEQDELREALAERLAGRGIEAQAKRKGEMHIFFPYALCNWEWVLGAALSRFGQVSEFEWRGLGFDHYADDSPRVLEAMNRAMLEAFYEANEQRPVDAVFGYLTGYTMDPKILAQMGQAGAVIFNFSLDDKLKFPGGLWQGRYSSPAGLAKVVDLNLTNAPESIIKYMVHGGLAMFWPEAAWPEMHRPYDLDFEFEVSFIGKRYGWRPRFIERLRKKGIQVECFGYGWANGPLSDEAMVQLYSRSRINLGFAGVGHSRRLMCLKGRDFEVPASGGLYLTQDNPELGLVYEVGREIVTYKDERDCAAKIEDLLGDPAKAELIRQAGHCRALAEHSWEHRFGQIFGLAGLLEEKVALQRVGQGSKTYSRSV